MGNPYILIFLINIPPSIAIAYFIGRKNKIGIVSSFVISIAFSFVIGFYASLLYGSSLKEFDSEYPDIPASP